MNSVLKRPLTRLCGAFRRVMAFTEKRPVYTIICIAPLLNLIVEMLSRRSFTSVFRSIWNYPAFFVLNAMIMFLTLLPSLFVRRRHFAQLLVCAIWLGLGVTNFVLMGYRTTPLSASDFKVLSSVWRIITVYLSIPQIIAIVIGFAAVITLIVVAFRRLPRSPRPMKTAIITSVFSVFIFVISIFSGYRLDIMPRTVQNLAVAYKDYGFAWCFALSIFDRGISEPKDYSQKLVEEIVGELDGAESLQPQPSGDTKANIIFVQLESFFDPTHLKNISVSSKPTRIFGALKRSCPSGYLTVPVVGAGTVNTEFEVLTGMSLDYFGTGEYPYSTVLRSETCESMAYNLRELGYRSHAIHNNTATFYSRNTVFRNLGFDSFTPLEYMNGVEYNPLGWAKDRVLTGEIMDALRSTSEPDFVYAISVEPHGKYPREPIEGAEEKLTVSGLESAELTAEYNYYVNELRQTDTFTGELIRALSDFDEPTVLVLYGDHLPSLEIEPEMLDNGSVYQTEYVIWSNFGLKAYDKDLDAYQLSAYVMQLLGYDNGILTKVHQAFENGEYDSAETYQQKLEALEYDMLYGEREVYNGVSPYEPTDLEMGVRKIRVNGAEQRGEVYFVYGENFTPYSEVYVGDEARETLFVDENTLLLMGDPPLPGDRLRVVQLADNGTELGSTAEYTVQ